MRDFVLKLQKNLKNTHAIREDEGENLTSKSESEFDSYNKEKKVELLDDGKG